MIQSILEARALVTKLRVMVEAEMPEAQRKMERGEDYDFDRVTAMLRVCVAIDELLFAMEIAQTGNPSFGLREVNDEERL